MDLKTTTRPRRHVREFCAVRDLLAARHDGGLVEVLEVGPGLAVRHLGRLSEEGRWGWDLFKRLESGIRRIPMPDACYESYETDELLAALEGLPVRLTVLDVNPRVLRVVAKVPRATPVATVCADLGAKSSPALVSLRGRFDLVVANAVLGRVANGRQGDVALTIRELVAPAGFLIGGAEFAAPDFARVPGWPGFHRRLPA